MDRGAYGHGGKYIIKLLFDSIEDFGADLSSDRHLSPSQFADPVDASRN